jgi:hypothetical protein
MDKELLNEIDKVCEEIINKGLVSLTKCDTELRCKSVRYLESYHLIRKDGRSYKANSETYKIKEMGIEKYLDSEKKKNGIPNVTYNYNKGILIQDSSFNNSKVLNKIKKPPTPKPIKKKPISERLIEKWWVLLVTVIGGVIVVIIQYKWFR